MVKYPYLTDTESQAVELLAEGKRLRDIKELIAPTIPKVNFYAFLAALRRKTGIKDVQSIPQCLAYRSSMERLAANPELTKHQATLLQRFVDCWQYEAIASRMDITEEEVKEETEAALALLGICATDPRTKRQQVRMHFSMHGNPNNFMLPPSPTHLKILRAIADGIDVNTLPGLERADIRTLVKESCQRINASSPGRNAQRKLVQAYLATHDNPMNDPMF